jgi:hypothetical protein
MNPVPAVTLDQLDPTQQTQYIDGVCDDPRSGVRKIDAKFLRELHGIALAHGFDNLAGADVVAVHQKHYSGVKNQAIHSQVMAALVRFNNEAVMEDAVLVVMEAKEQNRNGSMYFQFAGTRLASLAMKIGASDEVVRVICKHLSAAQLVSVLGHCVGDQGLVDRFDRLFPGTSMGQEALRQAIIADGETRTSPEWTGTYWIDLVSSRVDESHRVIGKPLLEGIIGSEIDRGLFQLKQPVDATALAASSAIPRDIAHLLHILTCERGWHYPHAPDFYDQLKNSNGAQRGIGAAALFGWRVALKSRTLGKALAAACTAATKASTPKARGVALSLATRKRLGIVA